MKCFPVIGLEAKDIEDQVQKVLRGLGNPEPPLNLELVRELLKLDRQFYRSTDTGAVREVISRIKVAGKQILKRPMLLWDVVRKAELSALYLPDARRILIDADKPKLKYRWNEAHEIGHSLIPWHGEMNLGDTDFTLRRECHEIIEAEANYAAGQLLFLQDRFINESRSKVYSIDTAKQLHTRYGNTITSTFWRMVESADDSQALVGLITQHPRRLKEDFDSNAPCKHCVPSTRFRSQFSAVTERDLFNILLTYCGHQKGGSLGQCETFLNDDNGDRHIFHFESYSNTYEVLSLGRRIRDARIAVSV